MNLVDERIILEDIDSALARGESYEVITIFFEETRKVADVYNVAVSTVPSYED